MTRSLRLFAPLLVTSALALGVAGCDDSGGELQILSVDPRNSAAQGRPVHIGGRNFRTDIGYTVFFGSKRSESVTILNPETMVVVAPHRDEPGTVDITIRADNGDAFVIHDVFEYQGAQGGIVERMGEGPERREGAGLPY